MIDSSILERFFLNTASVEERKLAIDWMLNPGNDEFMKSWMRLQWDLFSFPEDVEADYIERIWVNLQVVLQEEMEETGRGEGKIIKLHRSEKRSLRKYFKFTSAALIILVAGIISFIFFQSKKFSGPSLSEKYQTLEFQNRRIVLPDSSIVTLNGNSSLRYETEWQRGSVREVWLTGEGYFSVRHKKESRFIVHTRNGLDIEVLGTQFTAQSMRDSTRVVLNKGHVQLIINGQDKLDMRPGDLVVFDSERNTYTKKQVDPVAYSSWSSKELVFDNVEMKEVAARIKEAFGIHIVISEAIKNKSLNGKVSLETLDILLEAIEDTYEVKAERMGDTIYLR